jgi:hypothetical protein
LTWEREKTQIETCPDCGQKYKVRFGNMANCKIDLTLRKDNKH